MLLVFWMHLNLIIFREIIHEGHPHKIARIVNHDICDGKRELNFGISGVQIAKVYTNLDLLVLRGDKNNVGDPVRMLLLPDETRVYDLPNF